MSTTAKFTSNAFYERLIDLRTTNPEAFKRFSDATMSALRAYEEAKKEAEKGDQQ